LSRSREDAALTWRWSDIAAKTPTLALANDAGETLALWAGKRRLVRIKEEPLLRLDYLEVRPDIRGSGLGPLVLALIATDAAAAGASGIAFASIPERRAWYDRLGAEPLSGWSVERGLIPLVLRGESFEGLQEVANELEEGEDEHG
jgi:predicted N-acetyltransferase YhbS